MIHIQRSGVSAKVASPNCWFRLLKSPQSPKYYNIDVKSQEEEDGSGKLLQILLSEYFSSVLAHLLDDS